MYKGIIHLSIVLSLMSHAKTNAPIAAFWEQSPSQAEDILKNMSLEEKVGQLFMLGIYSYDNTPDKAVVEKLITKHHVGGFMFMYGSAQKQIELADYYQSLSKIPLMFSQDNEWGRVQRLKEPIKFPNSMTVGAIQENQGAYELGAEFGRRCSLLKVHMNFAPVVDVNNNSKNPVINDRSFGENKYKVAEKAIASMKGLQSEGVFACAKHFSGHGDVEMDSHLGMPVLDKSEEELEEIELYPFRKMIENGVQAVMTAHIHLPQIDPTPNIPVTLSQKVVTGILLEKLGFKGLVVTDALNMGGMTKYFSLEEAALKALVAGHDILLFGKAIPHPEEMYEYTTKSIDLICQAVKNGSFSEEELDNRVLKILMAKQWLSKTSVCRMEATQDINTTQTRRLKRKLYENAITVVKNENNTLPLSTLEAYPTAFVQVGGKNNPPFLRRLKNYCDAKEFYLSPDASQEELDELLTLLQNQEIIVIGLYDMSRFSRNNWGVRQSTLDLLSALKEKKVILSVFGNPYSLKNFGDEDAIVMAYEDETEAQIAAAEIIGGDLEPIGKLPVTASEEFKEGCGVKI